MKKKKVTKKKSGIFSDAFPKITNKKDKTKKISKKKVSKFSFKMDVFRASTKMPKFKLIKKSLIKLPDTLGSVKYGLIPPFAYAKIKRDNEVIYNLVEPKLSKTESEWNEKIMSGLLEMIDIELTAIKEKEKVIDYIQTQVEKVVNELDLNINKKSYQKIMYYIYRNFIGLNEIEPLLNDPYIEDISCDGVNVPVYVVHRKYGSLKTNIIYKDESDLKEFIVKIAERSGRFISYAEPLLDGSLPDGSRIQASFSRDVTSHGPTFTIRKFREIPFSPADLINNKTVSPEILAYLWLAVESGSSILIAGGTGTGKTSLLNVLSMFIPKNAKIISVEDTRELQLPHENWIPSVTRIGFTKEYGEVTMFDLLKESFRQSPDYVIVGEVRGAEAYVLFQGMAAGMPSIGTMHAGKVEDLIHRLETPPISLSPTLIETLDMVLVMVHARMKGESSRRLKEVVEIESVDATTGVARTNRVYSWLPESDTFEKRGYSWVLQKISKNKGVSIEDLEKEVLVRKKVIEWMQKKNITGYKEVADILSEYVKDKAKFIKKIGIE